MTPTSAPQPLAADPPAPVPAVTWVILGVAALLVVGVNLALGNSDTRACKREARDNAAVTAAVGGEERYIEICMQAHEKVRQIQTPRKP